MSLSVVANLPVSEKKQKNIDNTLYCFQLYNLERLSLIQILVINQEMCNHAIAYYLFFYAQTCLSMNQLLIDLIAGQGTLMSQ